jgi:hypothetical protein
MTRPLRVLIVVAISTLLFCAWSAPAQAGVSFDFFYSNLRPYGSWQVSAQYGRVWRPYDETRGWNPYYDGHWVYADVGWTWVSDYEWGAYPYHYGTWVLDPVYGWVWVPGSVWAPSWVVFRTGPDFIGWAPVAPGFTVGVSFGARVAGPFVFVSARNFAAPRIRGCVFPESRERVFLRGSRIEGGFGVERNVVVNRGPDVRFVERASGRSFHAVPIDRVSGAPRGRRFSRDDISVNRGGWGGRELRAASPVMEPRSSSPRGGRDGFAAPRDARRDMARQQMAEPRDDRREMAQHQAAAPRHSFEPRPRMDPRRVNVGPPRMEAAGGGRPPRTGSDREARGEGGRPPRHGDHGGHGH